MNTEGDVIQTQPGNSTSPIFKRTSQNYDHYYDSISAFSESTVADSDFVAQQITKYEKERVNSKNKGNNKQSTIYNLRIDKVVIDGAKNDKEIEKPVKAAMNQILNEFNQSKEKFDHETRGEKARRLILKPKFCVPVAMIIIIIILLSCGLPILLLKNKNGNELTTLAPSTTTGSLYPTSPATSTESTTTEGPFAQLKVLTREVWIPHGLDFTGKFKQLMPIKRIIILNTKTDTCYDESSCIEFIADSQQMAYPEFDDVKENFFIGVDGTVYEGRGFLHEGQASYESCTSFNSKAVSISFILQGKAEQPNEKQQEALCLFIRKSIDDKVLDENYFLFHHSELTSSFFEYLEEDKEIVTGTCNVKSYKLPKIVKRRDWGATDYPLDIEYLYHRISKKVILATTEGEACNSLEECGAQVMSCEENGTAANGQIKYNFIFGEDNLIFEGKGFDTALPDSFDSLWIAFLGEIETVEQGENRLERINKFLKFAMDLGKLSENYKLYGECQVEDNPSSPQEILFELMKNQTHFEET